MTMYAEFKGSWFSEIIGSFLMVALTVFIAAVIAVYVMGMMAEAPRAPLVVVTLTPQPDGSHLLTYHGGPDHPHLVSLKVSDGSAAWTNPGIGESRTVQANTKHIVVTGQFRTGGEQVVLDTTIR
jgi:FlaG/FlaF family flagellin (archaellin)